MNDNEADRIAAAINALRPDWPTKSIRTLIARDLMHRPRRDVAVALTWVACDAESVTPARVLEQTGPWWKAVNVEHPEATSRQNPKPHEVCSKHPGEYRLACRECAAEKKAARDARPPATQPLTREQLRQQLHEATLRTEAREVKR